MFNSYVKLPEGIIDYTISSQEAQGLSSQSDAVQDLGLNGLLPSHGHEIEWSNCDHMRPSSFIPIYTKYAHIIYYITILNICLYILNLS